MVTRRKAMKISLALFIKISIIVFSAALLALQIACALAQTEPTPHGTLKQSFSTQRPAAGPTSAQTSGEAHVTP